MAVYRAYVEKRPGFDVEAKKLQNDLKAALGLDGLTHLRLLNRYDIEGVDEAEFETVQHMVFSEPMVDEVTAELSVSADEQVFAVAYLPGQFDQRADSCEQCVQLLTQGVRPKVKNARIYILSGSVSASELAAVKAYIINPVESAEAGLQRYETLAESYAEPADVALLTGFCAMGDQDLAAFIGEYGLAMDVDDLRFCRRYFAEQEKRDPTLTEIRMIDTYWSDHCRHTTFLTALTGVEFEDERVAKSYEKYLELRNTVYGERAKTRPVTLMDIATIGTKYHKKTGKLKRLDESEEINACSVRIRPTVDGKAQDWLLMFKNETHNHPTEIEPFGGAATCLGGAIRDPLSGRSYVYQAMRVTGAADPNLPFDQTLKNKLPQKRIITGAAQGYSSYGNQIGLATGIVSEVYHPGYAAKRLETGAVIGAAPADHVIRMEPQTGDIVLLIGGRTGRDGCGGATGSSKAHNADSLDTCGAEVQKGNPPEERKIQRLFRNPEVTRMIRRCNDFGAGGVSVAIGELADGLSINLDAVLKKYEGLDGTELAISESQERMAVVVQAKDCARFMALAAEENLEVSLVAQVTDTNRLEMNWRGKKIVSLSRDFLNSNGAPKQATIQVNKPIETKSAGKQKPLEERLCAMMSGLNACSQKGLGERFDSTIGAGSVLMPFGGKNRLTPTQAMAALIPVLGGKTESCSLMTYGFSPDISAADPYYGGMNAIISSVGKFIAAGGKLSDDNGENCWLSLQEYFPAIKGQPQRWGLPLAALLGALEAQLGLGLSAIGGKDSMSGSFDQLDVPPTLISFAAGMADSKTVISPEFKTAGNRVYLIAPPMTAGTVDFAAVKKVFETLSALIADKKVISAYSISECSAAEAVVKMAFGNDIGVELCCLPAKELFESPLCGGFVVEAAEGVELDGLLLGKTIDRPMISSADGDIHLSKLKSCWMTTLEPVFPTKTAEETAQAVQHTLYTNRASAGTHKFAHPRVFIPVFPGTNCEYDLARSFADSGADPQVFVVKNLTPAAIEQTVQAMAKGLSEAQILAIPGGFSGGDEPDGSGKFITAFFNNPRIAEQITDLLNRRDGLAIGICNGFQALVKLGLVPYGQLRPMEKSSPTLTYNLIGRHQSLPVRLKVISVKSPWMRYTEAGDIYTVPVSHGEGRFVADSDTLASLAANGQIATAYVDETGHPTMKLPDNPNGSVMAIEGITSPDGRVFGKMAHDERCGTNLLKNIGGQMSIQIFKAGVDYFK